MKEYEGFYVCPDCGTVADLINNNGEKIICDGKEMKPLAANSVDAAEEKHVPVYERYDDEIVVNVGSVDHPMEKDHYIMWIAMVTDNKMCRTTLYPEQAPTARFKYVPGAAIYAYCNKHGLWMTKVD